MKAAFQEHFYKEVAVHIFSFGNNVHPNKTILNMKNLHDPLLLIDTFIVNAMSQLLLAKLHQSRLPAVKAVRIAREKTTRVKT